MQHYMKKRRLHGKILTLLNDNDKISEHGHDARDYQSSHC